MDQDQVDRVLCILREIKALLVEVLEVESDAAHDDSDSDYIDDD